MPRVLSSGGALSCELVPYTVMKPVCGDYWAPVDGRGGQLSQQDVQIFWGNLIEDGFGLVEGKCWPMRVDEDDCEGRGRHGAAKSFPGGGCCMRVFTRVHGDFQQPAGAGGG